MSARPRRTVLAVAAVLAAAIAVPAAHASAAGAGPQVTASPASGLDSGARIAVSLSGAAAFEGQSVAFAECNEATAQAHGGQYNVACTEYRADTVISGGSASGTVTAVYGQLPDNPDPSNSCTETNNGSCFIVAFAITGSGPTKIAATPITFAARTGAMVTASPSTNLDQGDQVAVSVTHIPSTAGTTIDIGECNTDQTAAQGNFFDAGCQRLAQGTSAGGGYSATVKIFDGVSNGVTCDETTPAGHCVLAAFDHANQTLLGTTPITFEPQSLHVSVTPATGLKDGQQVSVTATGIPSQQTSLYVLECDTAYAASHGYQDLAACAPASSLPVSKHAVSTSLAIVDGILNSAPAAPTCDYASNGDCAVVLLSEHYDSATGTLQYAVVGSPVAISFRPPVTGPAPITVEPTSELHAGSVVDLTVTSPAIPDGVDEVQILECNVADASKVGYDSACSPLAEVPVTDNTIPRQQVAVLEGLVGGSEEGSESLCDHTHACELGVFTDPGGGAEPSLVSNLVGISFRDPDRGTPIVTVSPRTGLRTGQKVKVSVSKLPDMVRFVYVQECNVSIPKKQWQGDSPPCIGIRAAAVSVTANGARTTAKVRAGVVGYANTKHGGKKVMCDSHTNGQCVVMLYQPQLIDGVLTGLIARSSPITFAPTKGH